MKFKFLKHSQVAVILLSATLLQACSSDDNQRWYTQQQAEEGMLIYQANCAVCHKSNGESVANWRQPLANGMYPPPPLNGSAHSWHHPLAMLERTIAEGGAAVGGYMPAFKDKLSPSERLAAIAAFQSFWSDEIYEVWSTKVNK